MSLFVAWKSKLKLSPSPLAYTVSLSQGTGKLDSALGRFWTQPYFCTVLFDTRLYTYCLTPDNAHIPNNVINLYFNIPIYKSNFLTNTHHPSQAMKVVYLLLPLPFNIIPYKSVLQSFFFFFFFFFNLYVLPGTWCSA